MSRRKSIPTYLRHKPTDQARVRINGRDVYLGRYDSPESHAEYARIVAELLAAASAAVVGQPKLSQSVTPDITVHEILLAFWRYAEKHYRRADGTTTNELSEYWQTFRPLRELYGHTLVKEFGPLALKAVRQRMVIAGLCRTLVNRRVGRVKRVFKWAASEQLVPVAIPVALATVSGLQRGRSAARETEPVKPVDPLVVEETIPFLTPTVVAMVRFQQLTGCRPQDVCGARPCDLDTTRSVWVLKPPQHKNAWRGAERVVYLGPQAQEILRAFWSTDSTDYFFSPRRSVEAFHASRTHARKTPLYPSHAARNATKRTPTQGKRTPGAKYTNQTYGRAILKAVKRANVWRDAHFAEVGPNLPLVPHWSPNQIRHAFATAVRQTYGLEAAQVLLGHEKADVTQVYAERNAALGERVAAEVG